MIKFEKLMKAIKGLETDEISSLKKVETGDSTYSSQHNSIVWGIGDLGPQNSGTCSDVISMTQAAEMTADSRKVFSTTEIEENLKMPKYLPTPMESSEDLSNYLFLVKNLLHEIEVLQYKLDHHVGKIFRESIKDAHIRTTELLLAKHGYERIFRVFNQALCENANVSLHIKICHGA